MSKVISSLQPLQPTNVYNARTGEILSPQSWSNQVESLLSYVQQETQVLYEVEGDRLAKEILAVKRVGSANSFGRSRGYASTYKTLPASILAKSRINELVLHKLVSETASYVLNPNPKKQPPTFARKVNLGAVNAQMASLSITGDILTLLWKCWEEEFLFEFTIPAYILQREVVKWSLPTVQVTGEGVRFFFAITEQPVPVRNTGVRAGVDLGKVEPFTLVVEENSQYHTYTASKNVYQLERKRDRILAESKHVRARLAAYTQLDRYPEKQAVLTQELQYKRAKARVLGAELALQLGADITRKLTQHKAHELVVEDLSWVKGPKYGGRWNHAQQQEAITHALARKGVRVRKTSPRNTSNNCHECGTVLVHQSASRSVRCVMCQSVVDRDFNAALNILKRQSYPVVPVARGSNGLHPEQGASGFLQVQALRDHKSKKT